MARRKSITRDQWGALARADLLREIAGIEALGPVERRMGVPIRFTGIAPEEEDEDEADHDV